MAEKESTLGLHEALGFVRAALTEAHRQWALIGGLAVSARFEPVTGIQGRIDFPLVLAILAKMSARIVNMHEAKTSLSKLVQDASEGKEIVIARAGKPVVRLVPLEARHKKRRLGRWKGKVRMSADFDAPLPEEWLAAWNGRAL